MEERNIVIAEEISKTNQDAFFITGAEHVYGLLENEHSKIDRNKFHIVPINLTSIISSYQSDAPEIAFLKRKQNAIQIENSAFTDPKEVIKKWNSTAKPESKQQKTYTPGLKNKTKSQTTVTESSKRQKQRNFSCLAT
jgi:ribosomal protein S30